MKVRFKMINMRVILVIGVVGLGVGCGIFPCESEAREVTSYQACRYADQTIEVGQPFEIKLFPSSYGTCTVNAQLDAGIIELIVVEPVRRANCGFPGSAADPAPLRAATCLAPGLPAGSYEVRVTGTTRTLTVPSSGADGGLPICPQY